jgi:hypothetical protein
MRVRSRGHGHARWEEAQFGDVKNSDEWIAKDGVDGVRDSYSSFVPSRSISKS